MVCVEEWVKMTTEQILRGFPESIGYFMEILQMRAIWFPNVIPTSCVELICFDLVIFAILGSC